MPHVEPYPNLHNPDKKSEAQLKDQHILDRSSYVRLAWKYGDNVCSNACTSYRLPLSSNKHNGQVVFKFTRNAKKVNNL